MKQALAFEAAKRDSSFMGRVGASPMTALSPGDHLDRYELLCVLAQGGMGTVWLARLTGKHGFERLVAVKTILATHDGDRHFSDMFLDEGRIASQIDHENVARILEIGEDRGVIYHAMELIDGESLRKVYRDARAMNAMFPLNVALRIIADLCAGLHAVHELRGDDGGPLEVVHRDVSPQNILVTVRGTVKLIDFGVAKARERRIEDTTAGTLKGKIEYMAPEQARSESVDRRADVYAVGAVLYELLAGKPVRKTDEGRQLLALHELMTGVPYEPLRETIPLPIRLIVDRSLARDPELRFQTADEMRRALEEAMSNLGRVTNSDDVAAVLAQFSHERTQRRKDAIEAALRTARALERERQLRGGSGQAETAYPTTPIIPPSLPPPASMGGPPVTGPVMPVVAPVPAIGEEPATRPSMRTMQGASMSEIPPGERPGLTQTQIFGGLIALTFVAMLGVFASFLWQQSTSHPTGVAPSAQPTPVPPPPTATVVPTTAAMPVAPSVTVAPPVTAAPPTTAAPIFTATAPLTMSPPVTAAPPVTAPPSKSGGPRKAPVVSDPPPKPPQRPSSPPKGGDDYGF